MDKMGGTKYLGDNLVSAPSTDAPLIEPWVFLCNPKVTIAQISGPLTKGSLHVC